MFSSNATQVSSAANYIEDVFSTYLYTGNGSTQTITNGINLSTYGGMTWLKYRSGAASTTYHHVYDSARGKSGNTSYNYLYTNTTSPQGTGAFGPTSFNTDGFSLNSYLNESTIPYVSWTFRKQPKFFDVVTYTGNDAANRQISHSLGSTPGCIIVKKTNEAGAWYVYHRSLGDWQANTPYTLNLNTTDSQTPTSAFKGDAPTSTTFTVDGVSGAINETGKTYVAYLFAHNAGGFGLTGTDNVISCGSFTTDGSGNATVNLGYEPQWVLYKRTSSAGSWLIVDNMRGDSANATNNANYLLANTSDAEGTATWFYPTATGFTGNANSIASTDFIYIAIRRGPMKVPTSGTSVFQPAYGTGGTPGYVSSFTVDSLLNFYLTGSTGNPNLASRLTGANYIATSSNSAEANGSGYWQWDFQTGCNTSTFNSSYVGEMLRRAPNFFDVVCYTGNGSTQNVNHNLGVVPEMMIAKRRDVAGSWVVYTTTTGNAAILELSSTGAVQTSAPQWNSTTPTASVFSLGTSSSANASGSTYVWYGFATCAGVSKVGSYTGTGALQTVNCGFTSGARFVLVKRTDSTGDWYVWDSARGITSGNDPYYLLNSTAAQVTGTNYVDTDSTGFKVTAAAPAGLNASGGTYIFLAIA